MAPKRGQIVEQLRAEIVSGVLAPNSRLPTRSELEHRFGGSSVTIQRAVDQLVQDGFVCSRPRSGSFVASHPPHLCRFGLVLPGRPDSPEQWSRFYTALCGEAQAFDEPSDRFQLYYGMGGDAVKPGHANLLHDLQNHCLAGLIFATMPYNFPAGVKFNSWTCPMLGIMAGPVPGIPAIFPDWGSFLDRAIGHLLANGRFRIAVLTVSLPSELIMGRLAARQLNTPSYFIQYAPVNSVEGARNVIDLLMRIPIEDRPDGLIIADDNLLEQASMALMSSPHGVAEGIHVVAHCNFPWPTPSLVPVRRLGFDTGRILRLSLDLLKQQRQGASCPALTLVPAVFEDELKANREIS